MDGRTGPLPLVLLALAACAPEAGRETATGAASRGNIICGAPATGRVASGGMFAAFVGNQEDAFRFVSPAHQWVTLQYDADYNGAHGAWIRVEAGRRVVAEATEHRDSSASLRFWADQATEYRFRVSYVTGHVYLGSERERGRWVSNYSDASGAFVLRTQCGGTVSCGLGTCQDAGTCGGTAVAGLCPGSAAIQCCMPRAPEPVPGETPPEREPAVDRCADYDWTNRCVDCDGFVDEGDRCCPYDLEGPEDCENEPPYEPDMEQDACTGRGGWCDCGGWEDCCDAC